MSLFKFRSAPNLQAHHFALLSLAAAQAPKYSDGMVDSVSSTAVVEGVGMVLFAVYHVAIIIVLINMLIAMMSHSFEDIQVSWGQSTFD